MFNQAISLNDALNLIPDQDITSMVSGLFGAKTAAGWIVAMEFNGVLDEHLKVSEVSITKMYVPIVGNMSWNSTPDHLKAHWWLEVGTRVATFTSKKQKKSLEAALPQVKSNGIVLDWGGIQTTVQYGKVKSRTPYTMVLNVFYENGRIEIVSEDIGFKKGSSKITLDQTASFIAKSFIQTYKFLH